MSASPASQAAEINGQIAELCAVLQLLICPSCNHPEAKLSINKQSLVCEQCNVEFPIFESGSVSMPWLFADPDQTLLEWKARLNGFLHINTVEQQRLKDALQDKRLSKTGQKRINKLLQAKQSQPSQVLQLISPLGLDNKNFDSMSDPVSALHAKVPKVQGLASYYDNIFRDWAWNNGENEQLLEAAESVLVNHENFGKTLTIGAGAGRLSYDIHQKYAPELSVLIDINPLLLFACSRIVQGECISLYEFPVAPLNKNCFTNLQNCQAPSPVNENFLFMFADGMNPPFKAQSFDTVLTPWLIDVVPQNLRDFIPRLNQLLKKGGVWINTGSLAFFHKDQTWCYSEEEVLELLEKNGFEVAASNRMTIQYLDSPISAHGRTEKVFNFSVKKVKDVAVPPKYEYLPAWILATNKSIPRYNGQDIESSKHLLQAQVLGAIDGNRSIEQIGELVAKQYNLKVEDAINAVRRIMIDLYEGITTQ